MAAQKCLDALNPLSKSATGVAQYVHFNSSSNVWLHAVQSHYSQVDDILTFHDSHCSLTHNNLTDTGAIALATAQQQNKSLEELK